MTKNKDINTIKNELYEKYGDIAVDIFESVLQANTLLQIDKIYSLAACKYHPTNKYDLQDIILSRIEETSGCDFDFNDIDTSAITDMSYLFDDDQYRKKHIFKLDISKWNVSNVADMHCMFHDLNVIDFGDLSQWDVSNVESMSMMFDGCECFKSDISNWDVSNVKDMSWMFTFCKEFNCDLSRWNVSNAEDMTRMFYGCHKFNQNLDTWDVSHVKYMSGIFESCPTKTQWYDNYEKQRINKLP